MRLRRTTTVMLGAVALLTGSLTVATASGLEPGHVLISQTDGTIWDYDIGNDDLTELARVQGQNFDIQYTGPRTVLVANNDGFVSELDLVTLSETVVADGFEESRAIAVSPRKGGTY